MQILLSSVDGKPDLVALWEVFGDGRGYVGRGLESAGGNGQRLWVYGQNQYSELRAPQICAGVTNSSESPTLLPALSLDDRRRWTSPHRGMQKLCPILPTCPDLI